MSQTPLGYRVAETPGVHICHKKRFLGDHYAQIAHRLRANSLKSKRESSTKLRNENLLASHTAFELQTQHKHKVASKKVATTQSNQLPVGLIAQLVEHCSVGRALHRYRRSYGFESRSGLNLIQALISQLLKLHA